ncbi:MAG: nucleotidyltransferase domain-containing protein [Terracidiphilus sp.]
MLTENDIARIAYRIAAAHAPLAVGTFGSYAIGSAHEGSDLDLFIIRKPSEPRPPTAQAIHRLLFGVLHPLDVHIFTPQEFEDTVYDEQSFTWIIVRQARLYHWIEDAAKAVPSLAPRALLSSSIGSTGT